MGTLRHITVLHWSIHPVQYVKAKETYLRACQRSPTSQTWSGVGVACYELSDLGQSEDALCEANILNNLDPVVWAYLTLVCLKVCVCVCVHVHNVGVCIRSVCSVGIDKLC